MMRMLLLRTVIVATVVLGANYIVWRWLFSLNWEAWWIAVPLVLAETYSFIDVCLFGLTVWMSRQRPAPPVAEPGHSVDVFVTTYNEPIDLVMVTARAARDIRYPHTTWVLDDGARDSLKLAAESEGIGYISRGSEWAGFQRHAKAGNINNALIETDGEFILILDADMIPRPQILDSTLGYFTDDKVALVQTPQIFSNVGENDPLGSQAPLFYGPIQQGKDGWNAAFFCGSNAILRRDALMQLGIVGYVREVQGSVAAALREAERVVRASRSHPASRAFAVRGALDEVAAAIADARSRLKAGDPIGQLTFDLHHRIDVATSSIVALDISTLEADLLEIAAMEKVGRHAVPQDKVEFDAEAVITQLMTRRDLSPLNALDEVQSVLGRIAIDRPGEMQPVMPLATISVTEDMATSMQLHALGWKTVYHHELLADGLAPEDLGTMLTQRLRWGQGTMQVFLRENPLLLTGMNLVQRLMYFATMWSYLSGFAAVVYFAAPIIFLLFGILPVTSFAAEFFVHFIPFIVVNQLVFLIAGRGIPTWRGQQYSLALFPVWIASCTTAFNNVVLRIPLGFAVTPKTRQESSAQWHLIRPQLVVMALLVAAVVVGIINLVFFGGDPLGTGVNVFWAFFDLLILSVLFGAVRYRGYAPTTKGS
jgi:cellulose synthase (UDP-forming)